MDGDDLTFSIVSDVSNGTTSLTDSTVTYTPSANFFGADTLTYYASDGTVNSDTTSVYLTITSVNDAPTTEDVSTTIDENRTALWQSLLTEAI